MKFNREKFGTPFLIETGLKLFLCGLLFFVMNSFEVFSKLSMFEKVLISLIPIWVDLIIMVVFFIMLASLTIMYLPELYASKLKDKTVNVSDDNSSKKE